MDNQLLQSLSEDLQSVAEGIQRELIKLEIPYHDRLKKLIKRLYKIKLDLDSSIE